MEYGINVKNKDEIDDTLSRHIKTETDDVNEEGILVIGIKASFTQVGKNNSIEQTGQASLRELVQVDGGEGSPDSRFDPLTSRDSAQTSLLVLDWEKDLDESNDGRENRHKQPRKPKAKKSKKKKSDMDLMPRIPFLESLGPVNQSAADRQFFMMSDDIMIHLQAVRDEGQWNTFDEEVIMLSRKYRTSPEAQIIILIERGHAACYSNNFKESKKLLKQAISEANGLKNTSNSLLIGRANYYLSAVYRRQKKNGKAIDCVKTAFQNFQQNSLVVDTAMLTYEIASAEMDFILQGADPRPGCLNEVMSALRRTIGQILRLKDDSNKQQRYLKTHRYAFIKMAMLLLDCRTATGRQRTVSEDNIKEAETHLDVIRERYWDETKRGEKIQFFLAQSDLHYRKQLYEKAEEYALEALSMAEEFCFNTEIQLVNERLQDIRQAAALARRDGSHGNKKLAVCLNGNHDNNTSPKSNTSNIPSLIACADGNHDNICDTTANADSDHGNASSEVYSDGSDSKKGSGSSEGHVGDVSGSSESDMLDSPSYV